MKIKADKENEKDERHIHKKRVWILLILLLLLLLSAVCAVCIKKFSFSSNEGETFDELSSVQWVSQMDQEVHTITFYTLGTAAQKVAAENDKYVMEHMAIDGAAFYYYHSSDSSAPLIIFLHGQGGEKEEFLEDFNVYAEMGYSCITLDLAGHGERAGETAITALESTVQTSGDIDLIVEYIKEDAQKIVLYGISQGGSVAYHYAAYGNYAPDALIVASTSPDFEDNYDRTLIINGKPVEGEEGQDSEEFIKDNNPMRQWENIVKSMIFSGNTLEDKAVSVTGSQNLERLCIDNEVQNATFIYYSGSSHDLPEAFFVRAMSFLEELR